MRVQVRHRSIVIGNVCKWVAISVSIRVNVTVMIRVRFIFSVRVKVRYFTSFLYGIHCTAKFQETLFLNMTSH